MLRLSAIFFILGLASLLYNHLKVKTPHPFALENYRMEGPAYFPLSVRCDGARVGSLDFQGRAIAHGDFLPKNPEELVRDQLKYIDGFVDYIDHSNTRLVPHLEKNFDILTVKKIPYPVDVFLDKIEVDSSHYPDEVLGKWYKKGAEAMEVTYRAVVKATRCKTPQESYDLILPLDPYLAYWYVPKDKRVEMAYGPEKKALTTPCAHRLMVQFKYPNMYWNVWMPRAKACGGFLREDLHLGLFRAAFTPGPREQKRVEFSYLNDQRDRIDISFVSGLLHPMDTDENLKNIRKLLENINSIDEIDREKQKGQDTATLATLTFMHLMRTLARDIHWSAEDRRDHLIFKSEGRLIHSKRPLSIQIYLGPTVDYQKGRLHWQFLSDALKRSDFIFYSGHSGMGYTLTLENLKKNSNFKTFENTPAHQFIAVLSCSSISYFGRDFIEGRNLSGRTTDFLLTGFDDHSYQLVPAVIQYIDLELAGRPYSLKSILTSHLSPDYDVHLTRN